MSDCGWSDNEPELPHTGFDHTQSLEGAIAWEIERCLGGEGELSQGGYEYKATKKLEKTVFDTAVDLALDGEKPEQRLLGLLVWHMLKQAKDGGRDTIREIQQTLPYFGNRDTSHLTAAEQRYIRAYTQIFFELLSGRSVQHRPVGDFGLDRRDKNALLKSVDVSQRQALSQKYFNYGMTGQQEPAGEWFTVGGVDRLEKMQAEGSWFEDAERGLSKLFRVAFNQALVNLKLHQRMQKLLGN